MTADVLSIIREKIEDVFPPPEFRVWVSSDAMHCALVVIVRHVESRELRPRFMRTEICDRDMACHGIDVLLPRLAGEIRHYFRKTAEEP
jgi:hypothetical protein